MPYFQVVSEELSVAGAMVSRSDTELSAVQSSVNGSASALFGTPAAIQYEFFASAAAGVITSVHDSVAALGGALAQAATAYQLSDSSAAGGLAVKRGG